MGFCKAHQLDMHGFCNKFDCPCIKHNCRFFGVKTNADRIRAMSDEELAELLEEMTYDSMEHRAEYWLRWLKQPAEGE